MTRILIEELCLPPGLGGGGFGVAIFHTKRGVEIASESWAEFDSPIWEVVKPFALEQLETVIREELAEVSYDGDLQDFEDYIVRFVADLNIYFALYGIDGYKRDGYDREGYDRFGYDRDGYDREGYDRITGTLFNADGYDRHGYDRKAFDRVGNHRTTGTLFDTDGYNRDGYDRYGYNRRCACGQS